MQDDRFKDAGQFHPEKAWSEIRRKDWEREHEGGLGVKGWALVIALLLSIVGTVVCALLFVGHYFL